MSAVKQYTSDSSSEESDQPEKQTDDNTGVGRSYECSFCKRGFTNAQALGGHMNIHRKDKAKSKGKNQNLESPKSHQEFTSQKYFSSISSEQRLYSSPKGKYMITHQLFFPSPNTGYLHACQPFDLGKDHHRTFHEYRLMDQNLSLRIGSSHKENERKNNMMEADIDLELRLGHP